MITGIKIGTRITCTINGKLFTRDFKTKEKAKEVFDKIVSTKDNIRDYSEELEKLFLPDYRIPFSDELELDFDTNKVYLQGSDTALPKSLVKVVQDYREEGYPMEPFINFWKLLLANPDVAVRESLSDFVLRHNFAITDAGYLITYKTVDYLQKVEDDLATFVSRVYLAASTEERENTYIVSLDVIDVSSDDENIDQLSKKRYKAIDKGTYEEYADKYELIGTLNDVMKKVGEYETSVYTDKYTHTMRINIGEPVTMDRDKCNNDPSVGCSEGLHVGSSSYVDAFRTCNLVNGTMEKSPVLCCFVNPMNVVAVPNHDNSKMRVCEYYPFARAEWEDGTIQVVEKKYFESDYKNYEEESITGTLSENQDLTKQQRGILENRIIYLQSEKPKNLPF